MMRRKPSIQIFMVLLISIVGFFLVGFTFALNPLTQKIEGQETTLERKHTRQLSRGITSIYSSTVDHSLQWNTFAGMSGTDFGNDVVVDSAGNIYVVGSSEASWGHPIRAYSGLNDIFVAKYSKNGSLIWNTFLGTTNNDYGNAIALDQNGNIYITGVSVVTGYYGNVVVAKLTSNGIIQWEHSFGSAYDESGEDIAIDGNGNIIVIGNSHTFWGNPINNGATGYDFAFVLKLDNSGGILWNTFLGNSLTYGDGIMVGEDEGIYIVGKSYNTWGTPINPHVGGYNMFVAGLNSAGILQWNTFLGRVYATGGISNYGIGKLLVVGTGQAWGSPVNAHAGGNDASIIALSSNGSVLWNTFVDSSALTRVL